MDRSTRLIVLCICAAAITTAAAVSIDVGASAVNGVWRPSSCNDVKDGVVLTNIADNIRATIVGCTIVVDAGASLTSSAVSIGNMGVNATLAFVDCTIRSTFATTATSWTQRHSTLRIATGSAGAGSHIVIRNTTVSFTETTSGKYGAAVMIDHGFTAGANFRFTIEDSSDIQASCVSSCIGVLILGTISGESTKTQLGPRSRFTIDASSVSASASTNTAYGVFFFNNIIFGDDSRIAISRSNVSVTVPTSSAHGFRFDRSIKFGKRCIVSIDQSRINATAGTSIAYSVSFYNPITFGASTSVAVTASTLNAAAGTGSRGYNIVLWGAQIQYDGDHALTIDRSSLHSSANSGSGGIFFRSTDATSLAVTISASAVVFQSQMSGGSVPDTGVVVCHSDVTWSSVSLTVSSSQFTAGPLMKAGVLANYVTWPKSIDGTSPQSFDVVTFSAPAAAGPIAAFGIQTGGTGPVGQTTLCFRYLWGESGRILPSLAISSAFQTPAKEVCWPPTNTLTISGSSSASLRSLTATQQRSVSNTATLTLTATSSLDTIATTSMRSTVSGSPSSHASPTVSLRRRKTQSQSGSISAAISKTHTVRNETSKNSSRTTIASNTLTRTSHTFASPSKSHTPLKTKTVTKLRPRSATLSGVSTTRTLTDLEHSLSLSRRMTSSPTLVADMSLATITQRHPPDGPRAVLGAPTLPPATDAVARTATATSGAVAAFVGAGVSGATQAGRTLAIMQLVMCTAKSADDDAELETNNNAADPTETAPRSGVNGHRDESDEEDKGRPFPQALLPWIKLGDGDAGWSRGVVIGNVFAVVLLLLLGTLVWAVLSKIVHRISVAKPDSFAARLGASAEDSAPPSANTAEVRMCRLLRFPGVAVTIPLAFATDGCIGESVALIRHGVEGRFGAGPLDIVFGSVAVLVAGLLWGALLYITVLVVPRNVHIVNATALTNDHNQSSPHSSHTIHHGLSHHPPQESNRTSKLYSQARVLRDGSVSWAVLSDSTDVPTTTSASSSELHSFSSASPSAGFNDPFLVPCEPSPSHTADEEKGRCDEEKGKCDEAKWRCDQARQLESRHLFAARWAILFAPLHRRALPFTAIDCAASIAVATARGLRPRTPDGCQRALIAVAVAQVLLLVVILVLRPFLAPLKTAVSVAASGLLAAAAIVGAVAGSTEGGDRRSAEDAAVTAGYLAVAASVALLANPAMALWRVVEGRLIARKTDAAKTTDAAAGAFYELLHGDAGAPLLDPFGELTTDDHQMLSPPAPIHASNSIDMEMTTFQNCEVGGAEEQFTSPMSEEQKSKEKQNRRVTFVSRVPSVESFLETAAAVMDDPTTVSDEVAVGEEALSHAPSSNRLDQEEAPSFVWSDADENDDGLPPECLPTSDYGPFDPDDFNPLDENVASVTTKQRVVKEKAGKGAELAAELEEMLGSWR